ncbi:MAG: acyl-[acyl-carrier-protein] thioesterase [Solirubrobacterales bacterium]
MIKPVELVELAPEPPSGRVFERTLLPGIADASGEGRCRLDAIARWLQDIAYADLVDAGFDGRGAWVVRRTRIRAEAFPRFGEQLTLRTWCSGLGRFSAERRTAIRGDSARADSVSLWICLDLDRGRPMRFPRDFIDAYSESAAGRDANVRLRHPEPPDGAERSPWRFRATEIDTAGHVNNSHYWVPLEEEIAAGPEPAEIDAELEYRDPARAGEVALLRDGPARWIASRGGALHASIVTA